MIFTKIYFILFFHHLIGFFYFYVSRSTPSKDIFSIIYFLVLFVVRFCVSVNHEITALNYTINLIYLVRKIIFSISCIILKTSLLIRFKYSSILQSFSFNIICVKILIFSLLRILTFLIV